MSENYLSNAKRKRRWRETYMNAAKDTNRIPKANGGKSTLEEAKQEKERSGAHKAKSTLKFKLTASRQKLHRQLQKEHIRTKLEYQQNKETSDTRHDYLTTIAANFDRKS